MEETLQPILEDLQTQLAYIDLFSRQSNGRGMEFLVLRKSHLVFKIDPNRNHATPHFHVDYGKEYHALSYDIMNGRVLVGDLPSKYLKKIAAWNEANRQVLLNIWTALRESNDPKPFLLELKGDNF